MVRSKLLAILVLVCCTMVSPPYGVKSAPQLQETQTPTPAPTATPDYWLAITLPSSGHTVIVERRFTYGEASVVIALIAMFTLVFLGFSVLIARAFARRL